MNPEQKKETDYPTDLESQLILRLPDDPAKLLKEILQTGEHLKNRLSINIDNDMRHGEVRIDQWTMQAKIVDLPTITESLKTIDNKNFYKTADVCQMMICKEAIVDQAQAEEDSASKNKKKDPLKVDKKFLWPHGITPPTKNVRKRRFRKTLRKKCVDAPEIEREVKRLLRADNEAVSFTWEIIQEDEDQIIVDEMQPVPGPSTSTAILKTEKKSRASPKPKGAPSPKAGPSPKPEIKADPAPKAGPTAKGRTVVKARETPKAGPAPKNKQQPKVVSPPKGNDKAEATNIVDIFGGAVSDSDPEDSLNIPMEEHLFAYDTPLSDNNLMQGLSELQPKRDIFPVDYNSPMFQAQPRSTKKKPIYPRTETVTSGSLLRSGGVSSDEDFQLPPTRDISKENMTFRIEHVRAELEELKQRRQRTQYEIAGMENVSLKQRFQDILHTLNQDIMFKEMEYQGMLTYQNSEDI